MVAFMVGIGIIFGTQYINGNLEFKKPEFDFSEASGGRCVEWEVLGVSECLIEYRGNVTGNMILKRQLIVVNLSGVSRFRFPFTFRELYELRGISVDVVECEDVTTCISVTNTHNVTAPLEIAMQRGYKNG